MAQHETRGLASRSAWWCLLAMVASVPLITSNLTVFGAQASTTFDQFDLPKLIALAILAGVGFVAWAWSLANGECRVRLPGWTMLSALALVVIAVASTALSVDPSTSLFGAVARRGGLLTLVFALVAGWLTIQLVDRPSRARRLAQVTVAAGAMVGLYALLQVAGMEFVNWGQLPFEERRAFATLGNPDLLGGYLVVALALAPALALGSESRRARLAWWAVSGLVGVAWLATFVRGSWVAGAVSLAVLAFAAWRARVALVREDRVALIAVAVVLATVVVVSGVTGLFTFSALERVGSLVSGGGSVAQRISIWSAALAAFVERPALGWGPDAFRYAFLQHRPATDLVYGAAMRADDAHSIIVQLLVTTGALGALAWLFAVVSALVTSARSVFASGGGSSRLIFAAWFAVALGVIVHGLVGVMSVSTTMFLWVALGAALAPTARGREATPTIAYVLAGVGIVVAGAAAFGLVRVAAADAALIAGMVSTDSATRIARLEAAVSVAPWDHTYRVRLGDSYAGAVSDSLASGSQPGESGTRAADAYAAALRDVPREHDAALGLAQLDNDLGAFESEAFGRAEAAADAGISFAPTSLPLRLERAEALANLGRLDEAITELRAIRDWDPNAPEPGILLVAVLSANGQNGEALEEAQALVSRYPDDPRVLNALEAAKQAASEEK